MYVVMNNSIIPQIVSVSELQRNYAALIEKAKRSGQPLLVLRKNKLEIILLNSTLFEEMARKAKLYEEKQALEAIAAYETEKKKGKLKKMKNTEELFATQRSSK